ncbi:MAG: hypothetical protein JXK95_13790, partial [Bacteroidales bacterium]|nr:hypothetical protein [Bacteroidales bacterium]
MNPPPGGSGTYFSLLIGADAKNVKLTGGTINITVPTNRNAYINSTAPLWNLNITSTSDTYSAQIMDYGGYGSPSLPVIPAQPLIVLNDLNIQNNAVFITNNNDVTVAHDFIVGASGAYTPGTNTTAFNGSGSQLFDMQGAVNGNLNNLVLENTSSLTINNNNPANPVIINADLQIDDSCTFIDNGRIVQVLGDITNSGTHFKPVSGAGSIQLTATTDQNIFGNGTGTFNNLTLNKTAGSVTLHTDAVITGNLRLANAAARLNIGLHILSLSADADIFDDLTGTGKNFSASRMIVTSGLVSDGGIRISYSGTDAYLFPVGFYNSANATYYYLPASIQYSAAPSAYGSVTTRPVNARHPLSQNTNSLACYWNTQSNGFTGVPAGSVIHNYFYDDNFVSGTESNYIPAVYRNNDGLLWTVINDPLRVNDGTNIVTYDTAYKADGEYTAGELTAFSAIPIRYSTGINGDWDNTATWSSTGVGGPGGASVPDGNTIVIIGDETHHHTVTINQNNRVCGSLTINDGSTLDLRDNTGHNFEALPEKDISGTGTLRIASNNYFPRGDFGDFIGETGGTVEYYTITPAPGSISIPEISDGTGLVLDHYYNLKISSVTGTTITLPNSDLTIYNDLSVNDAGQVLTNTAANHLITVNNDFNVFTGTFEVRNNQAQTIKVFGDLNVTGNFSVQNSAAVDHVLELFGSLIGNGVFDVNNGTGLVHTFFKGFNNAVITGTPKDFYSLEVDKGTSQTPVLDVSATITTSFDPRLTLKNGTFRLSSGTFNVTTAAAFTIPETGCLSANGGTLNVITSDNNNNLNLVGKLEILSGTVNVGNTSNNNRNDIEYSAGGQPEIVLQNGTLNIKGQIKRNSGTTQGSLRYTQTGGNVHIYGKNFDVDRAKFEICNSNSSFTFSNGNIYIYRGGGSAFGDVYLRPNSDHVTGGSLILAPGSDIGAQTYNLDATCNLHHLNVAGFSGASPATARLTVNPLDLSGNLTIAANSTFNCNDKNVNIAGDYTNNGTYSAGTNTTTFNGGNVQTATFGVNTTFNNVIIEKTTGSVITFTSPGAFNPTITDSLVINSGTLENAGTLNIISLGNIINNGVHNSTGSGNLTLSGTTNQIISGNGSGEFGNVSLANGAANGATLAANIAINGILTLNTGYLYVNDYLLTLGASASIAGSPGLPASNNWIITNGVLSDAGVKKVFPAASPTAFTFPVGVAGKYTPVDYNVTYAAASPGSITVRPVNIKIPSLTNTFDDELQYYWYVTSTPFGGLTSITHVYHYLDGDVTGTETNYVGGRYYNLNWTNLGAGVMNTTVNTITISSNYIDGEYTCGDPGNFLNKPVYYSYDLAPNITSTGADWNTAGSWATGGHNGTVAATPPDGNPIIIKSGHRINIEDNDRIVYSVENYGILDADTTTGHNLGHVSGDGRIIISNTTAGQFVFPGGDFSEFMNTTNSTVEYNGSNGILSSSISSTYKTYQNLEFTGPISKNLSNVDLLIKGHLLITGSQVNNAIYNRNITLWGDWEDNIANGYAPGKGMVSFEGSALQTLITPNPEYFYNFRINNAAGVTLNGTAEIANRLYLTSGNINTTSANLLTITKVTSSAVTGGSDASFVDGPLAKQILSGQSFDFPVGNYNAASGKPARYGNVYLSNVSATNLWIAQYINDNPDGSYSRSNLLSPLTSVSDNEYWIITRPGSNTANIRLRWDEASGIASVNAMRVTEWVTPANQWEEKGGVVSGSMSSGTVSTSTPVTTPSYVFTLGVSGVTAHITNVTPTAICNNGEIITVTVELTGTPNWTIGYNAGSNSFSQSGIGSSTFNIQLTGADFGGPGSYDIQLTSVSDISGNGVVDPTTYPITVLDTYIPDIQGTFTVGSGEVRNYYTTDNSGSGSTYAWNWQGANGGTIATPDAASTDITMATAATYQLQVTETSPNGCVAADIQSITVLDTPSPQITPDDDPNVCLNETITYSTPDISGHTYTWTVVGGVPATGTGNSIDITWNATGNGSVTVVEANGPLTGSDVVNVVVDPQPNTALSVNAPVSVCYNTIATITVVSSETGFNYQLRSGGTNIGSPLAGTGGNINLPSESLTSTTAFNVLAYNNGCSFQLIQTPTVDVNPEFDAGAITGETSAIQCSNYDPLTMTANPTGGSGTYNYQWQSSPDGSAWSDISGQTAVTFNPPAITATTHYRVMVDPAGSPDCGGPTASTNTIVLTILPEFNPGDITGETNASYCTNYNPATMTANPTGGSGTYNCQWQSSPDGSSWSDIAGATSVTYDPPAITATSYYRVMVDPSGSPDCGSATASTNTIVLTILPVFDPGAITGETSATQCTNYNP